MKDRLIKPHLERRKCISCREEPVFSKDDDLCSECGKMYGVGSYDSKKANISLMLERKQIQKLINLSKRNHKSISAIVRLAVDLLLALDEGEKLFRKEKGAR